MLPLVNPLLHTLVLLVAMAITASGAASRVVFTEAFDHTGNHPLGFTDVCEIHEAPMPRSALQFPITARSPITVESPGQNAFQWQHNGTGNRKIDYPIKLTGIAISMPRQAVNLTKMEPVKTTIRLGELGAY